MADQRIVPLGSETDSSGLVSKFFMYQNTEHPAYPKFFVRKTSRVSGGCVGLVRNLLSRARHEGVQEGLLNAQGNSAPNITFDFDKQSIEDQSFVRHLTSARIIYILFRAAEAGRHLSDHFLFFKELPTKAVKVFAIRPEPAEIRFENPFVHEQFLQAFEASVGRPLQQLIGSGMTLEDLLKRKLNRTFQDLPEAQRGVLLRVCKEVDRVSKANFFMLVFGLFCLKTGKPSSSYSQNESSFLQNVQRDLDGLDIHPALRDFFRLVLLQTDFSKVPSFESFIDKFVARSQPCESPFDSALLTSVQTLATLRKASLELTALPTMPNSGIYIFSEPRNKTSAASPGPGGQFFVGVAEPARWLVSGNQPIVSEDVQYGLKVRRSSHSPTSTPRRLSISTNVPPPPSNFFGSSPYFQPSFTTYQPPRIENQISGGQRPSLQPYEAPKVISISSGQPPLQRVQSAQSLTSTPFVHQPSYFQHSRQPASNKPPSYTVYQPPTPPLYSNSESRTSFQDPSANEHQKEFNFQFQPSRQSVESPRHSPPSHNRQPRKSSLKKEGRSTSTKKKSVTFDPDF